MTTNDINNFVLNYMKDHYDSNGLPFNLIRTAQYMIQEALEINFGLDWKNDENFRETPDRVARAILDDLCIGINSNITCKQMLEKTFPSSYSSHIMSIPIEVHSICPHHFIPVKYKCAFSYIPNGKVIGLSKIPRTIKLYGKQPILQEDFTRNYTNLFQEAVNPIGCAFVVKGQHGCMLCRGVEVNDDYWVTTESRTLVYNNPDIYKEFLNIIGDL
jgi:GTP cyclohydrolase I